MPVTTVRGEGTAYSTDKVVEEFVSASPELSHRQLQGFLKFPCQRILRVQPVYVNSGCTMNDRGELSPLRPLPEIIHIGCFVDYLIRR